MVYDVMQLLLGFIGQMFLKMKLNHMERQTPLCNDYIGKRRDNIQRKGRRKDKSSCNQNIIFTAVI